MDADGDLFLTGRSKEILNRGGEKISPREIDEVLMEPPRCGSASPLRCPIHSSARKSASWWCCATNLDASEVELPESTLRARLADFKVPRRVFTLNQIPTGPTGKLQRIGLAERLRHHRRFVETAVRQSHRRRCG